MAKAIERGQPSSRYFLRFTSTALLLVSGTLVLVLVVLPNRYVLNSGFVESGLSFPNPGVPFVPLDPVQIAALPTPTATTPGVILPGPAEVFWDQVLPLLDSERFPDALPVFEEYLAANPTDVDVRRELALTLIAAGRGAEAVPVIAALLRESDDADLRLVLARTLRDLGRVSEASIHYRLLSGARPDDEALALEWAQALAWVEEYGEAEDVLLGGLDRHPESVPLRAELARIYYYTDRLPEAQAILEAMSEADLSAVDALTLRADVRAALEVPVILEPPPTLLEQAVAAREEDDFDGARTLFESALRADPDDAEAWLAYANFLEYELGDFEGARAALLEVESLEADGARIQFRLALLEAWTGRSGEVRERLTRLLTELDAGTAPISPDDDAPPITSAEVLALLGDLDRWDGNRLGAAERYQAALEADPLNERARDGLAAVDIEVALLIDEVEAPRMGSRAYGLGDTDDFGRVDLGGEWIGVNEGWVWSGSVGNRWLSGRDLATAEGTLQGAYLELTPARWWRYGTIRTSVHLGAQWVRDGETDISLGAAVQYRALGGSVLNVQFRHEPAYPLTATLQSVLGDLRQDRLLASFDRAIGDRWSLAVQADVALLDPVALTGAPGSTRLGGAVSLARTVTRAWTLGVSSQALTYTEAAPIVGTRRLFWDPLAVFAVGPYAQVGGYLSDSWEASLRLSPGLALIDERGPSGSDVVPQLSAEARFEYAGPRFRSAVDLFYSQARLEGYRMYGVRFSLSAKSWLSWEPGG